MAVCLDLARPPHVPGGYAARRPSAFQHLQGCASFRSLRAARVHCAEDTVLRHRAEWTNGQEEATLQMMLPWAVRKSEGEFPG